MGGMGSTSPFGHEVAAAATRPGSQRVSSAASTPHGGHQRASRDTSQLGEVGDEAESDRPAEV
jgi:hypothetical protein